MSVFFVHDAGQGIVSPLDRKFHVRDIPPTEALQEIQRIHEKKESDPNSYPTNKNKHETTKDSHKRQDALNAYQAAQPKSQFGRVRDIMSHPVLSINKGASLNEAWLIMSKYEIHHLVILDDAQQYCGMLSEKKMVPELMKKPDEDIMLERFCNERLLSCHPDMLIGDLAPALLEAGLDAIAVYEQGKIIGIVTYSDVLKVILKAQQLEVDA